MSSQPLVSCIMPTRDRRAFVPQAVWYFLRQDYPARELVVVDDGADGVADLIPADPRIRYLRRDRRETVGAKRNVACAASQGELIAHWDDDDWMSSDRLSRQVAAVLAAGADACGTRELLCYSPSAAKAWRYRYDDGDPPWLAGGTLLYRRSAWAERGFPEIDVGEDASFVASLGAGRLHVLSDASFYVAVMHGANTGAKDPSDPHFEPVPVEDVIGMMRFDRSFYVGLRNGASAAAPAGAAPARVSVVAPFAVFDGYGSMAEYLVVGMARAGATVDVVPLHLDPAGLSPEFRAIADDSRPDPAGPVLFYAPAGPEIERFAGGDLFVRTMWESSRLPAGWTARLNAARAVLVPSTFVAGVCGASGVTAPVRVIPEGVDPAVYRPLARPERPGLTTLIVGSAIPRKHVRESIEAWKRAFEGDADARLIVKARIGYRGVAPDDPRITFVVDNEPTRGIVRWYRQADVLLALGNEGFGLPLVEGMATGLPVVALATEGQADACREAAGYVLPVGAARWEPAADPSYGTCGVRAVPDVEQAAAHLRWVAGHRDEAREMGRAASRWARRHRSVWSRVPAVLEVMERESRSRRPLRRLRSVWVPSWGSACGIAEYASSLLDALPTGAGAAHAVATRPDPRALRLLHIQHEDSLFDDAALAETVAVARDAGAPVVVTEHTVTSVARAWERDASALVAMTGRGASMLRARWPSARVEHLPHGCPTWFPPRKRDRGAVIGAFGFLEPHKGFWDLLDVLRSVRGSSLLMFSHARSPENESRWDDAARGLPVRRVRTFVPARAAARRLAAEADVLAFWYGDVAHASASGAVRIGLATGVPVLASPTGWFSELREVTHQPATLADGVRRLLDDTALRDDLTAAAREYCNENSWQRSARRHLSLWHALESA